MQTGCVKWFNIEKGFGFIKPEDGSQDVFVHFKEIQCEGFKSLSPNDIVSFVAVNTPKGIAAHNVKVLGEYAEYSND